MPESSVFSGLIEAQGIEALNSNCFCVSLNEAALNRVLESELGEAGLYELARTPGGGFAPVYRYAG